MMNEQLVLHGEVDPFALAAVPQGCVVDLDVSHSLISFRRGAPPGGGTLFTKKALKPRGPQGLDCSVLPKCPKAAAPR